ncbi:MAG: hypothetical protein N2509_09340 [Treponemataceae bacterium]|nr:hypothetical protein [Treponemataceae bacterium]
MIAFLRVYYTVGDCRWKRIRSRLIIAVVKTKKEGDVKMDLRELFRDALSRERYKIYISVRIPPLERGFLVGIPFAREDFGVAEIDLGVPQTLDYGDLIWVSGMLYLVIPEFFVEHDDWYWNKGPWFVVNRALFWNGARYYNRCVYCGADGPVDFYCKVCGA